LFSQDLKAYTRIIWISLFSYPPVPEVDIYVHALIEVWGAEARYLSENDDVVGNAYRDDLLGDVVMM